MNQQLLALIYSFLTEDDAHGAPSMWIRLLRCIAYWAPFGKRVIWSRDGESPYLLRVNIVPRVWRLPAVFLHMFFRGDDDDEHHNHPWHWSCSLVLAGGYKEERIGPGEWPWNVRTTLLSPGRVNVIRRNDFHRVVVERAQRRPWTLFVAGRRVDAVDEEAWGFKHPVTGNYQHWRAHVDGVRAKKGALREEG
jgi:hypothetical protein